MDERKVLFLHSNSAFWAENDAAGGGKHKKIIYG